VYNGVYDEESGLQWRTELIIYNKVHYLQLCSLGKPGFECFVEVLVSDTVIL